MTRNSRGDEYSGGGLESDYPPPPLPSSSAYTAPYLRHVAKVTKPSMSPTVRRLAEKANDAFHARMGGGAGRGTFYFDGFASEFARLLITECVAVGEKAFVEDNSKVPIFPAEAILKHFDLGG